MKKKLLISFLITFCSVFIFEHSFAQTPKWLWAIGIRGINNEEIGYSKAVDDSGNIYTTGTFIGTVDFDPGAGVFNLKYSWKPRHVHFEIRWLGQFCLGYSQSRSRRYNFILTSVGEMGR
jgi:hypothetical protein